MKTKQQIKDIDLDVKIHCDKNNSTAIMIRHDEGDEGLSLYVYGGHYELSNILLNACEDEFFESIVMRVARVIAHRKINQILSE